MRPRKAQRLRLAGELRPLDAGRLPLLLRPTEDERLELREGELTEPRELPAVLVRVVRGFDAGRDAAGRVLLAGRDAAGRVLLAGRDAAGRVLLDGRDAAGRGLVAGRDAAGAGRVAREGAGRAGVR